MSKFKINYLPELSALILGRPKPSMVSVNLTERCNQRCVYCEIGTSPASKKEDILTKEDMFWIIDQMAITKMTRLSMCGGEPFLFPHIISVIAYAWKNNIRCNITSNGMLIYRLKESDLDVIKDCETAINISVDSFVESIQTLTRGSAYALPEAVKSIQCLKEKQIPVTILSAISTYNYHDLFDSLQKAWEIGITQVLYQPIIYYSNYADKRVIDEKSKLNVSIEELDTLMDQLAKINRFERSHQIKTNVYRIIPWIKQYIKGATGLIGGSFYHEVLKKFYCREVYAVIDISYDGGIQACGLSHSEVNIKTNNNIGLLALWTKGTARLKEELKNENYPVQCDGCCHKFSRNRLASVIKYPLANRLALTNVLAMMISRAYSTVYKRILIRHK